MTACDQVDKHDRGKRSPAWKDTLAQVFGSTEQLLAQKIDAVSTSVDECRAVRKVCSIAELE